MTTNAGRRLSEAHRLAQRRLGIVTIAQMRQVWRLLDVNDLDGSFAAWLASVEPIVQRQRAGSSLLAASYVSALRAIEIGPDGRFTPTLADPMPDAMLRTSMLVTGPVSIKSKMSRLMPIEQASREAEAQTAGAGMRHALNGGRETVVETVKNDERASGWRRLTSGNPCDFCSTLASNGATYSESTVGFHAHDSCSCSAEPVYR